MARTVLGKGPRPAAVMVIGEAPGETEDRTGLPFCGKAGKELDRGLALADLDRRDVFVTNVCKQRPANNKLPTPAEVAYWRPALIRELAQVRPRVIVAAGGLAAAQFLPPRPMEALHGIPHLVDLGRCGLTDVPDRAEAVATVVPIYHPAAPLHDTTLQTAFSRDWYNVARTLDGALPVWTPDPEPVTVRLVTEDTLDNLLFRLTWEANDVAVDTEGDREHPWGLSFAWTPHEAWVIPATAPRLCQRLSEALQEKTVILHWALHDLAVLRALGLSLGARCEDTLRYARYVAEAGGLKALAYRFARRTLSEYSDVAAPLKARYYRELALRAVEQYPLPPPKPKRSDFPRGFLGQLDCWEAQERWQRAEAVAPLRRAWLAVAGSDDPAKAWKTRAGKTLPPVPVWTPPTDGPFLQYAGEDAAATLAVLPTLRKLAAPQAEYAALDNGILPLLDRMQAVGLPVDRRYLEDLSPLLQALRDDLRAEMIAMLGMSDDFNPDSGPQVKAALFGLLGLTPTRFSKLTGEPAADEKFLEPLRSQVPFIDCLLQYRELGKLDGTYVQGWLAAIQADGRLRTHLDIGAKTGRLTADKPNVLAIPKHGAWGKLFRNAVRVHVPGRVLASWDMSQIELRVLGEMSQDPDLCRAFREGRDIHSETASRIWKIPIERLDETLHRLPAKCFHPDTEVLTPTGWKRIPALSAGEAVMQASPGSHGVVTLEWAVPTEVFTTRHASQQLIHLQNKGIDIRVTPDHRMLGWRVTGSRVVATPQDWLTQCRYWANAGLLPEGAPADITRLRLAVALQADGSITRWGSIRWGFVKARKIQRLRNLLQAASVPFTESRAKNGRHGYVHTFAVHKADAQPLIALLDPDKTFPWQWLTLGPEARTAILDEVEHWDGCRVARRRIVSSTRRKNLDVLQALAAITSTKSRIRHDHISLADHATSRAGAVRATVETYTEDVACLAVPSSFVLVRDQGVTLICGQTTNFGIPMGISGQGLSDQMGKFGIPGWDPDSCERMIDEWKHKAFPRAGAWLLENEAEAMDRGRVVGWGSKVFWLEGIWSTDRRVVEEAKRQASALKIQGGAQVLMKRAMIRLWQDVLPRLQREGYIEPLIQIHDELLFEMDETLIGPADELIVAAMTKTTPLSIPVLADGGYGPIWAGKGWEKFEVQTC